MSQIGEFVGILKAIKSRIRLMIGRGVLTLVDDERLMQELQVKMLSGEVLANVEHWQPYGFAYHPHPKGEALMVFPKADRSHGICIAVADRRYRLQALAEGEVALYDDLGKSLVLKRNGDIEVNADRVLMNCNLEVNGDIHATGTIIDDGGNTNNHSH